MRKVKTLIGSMLLVLYVLISMSSTLFYHTHTYSWGVVSHSHPYLPGSDGGAGHSHTQQQIDLISAINSQLYFGDSVIIPFVFLAITMFITVSLLVVNTHNSYTNLYKGRAPPVCY